MVLGVLWVKECAHSPFDDHYNNNALNISFGLFGGGLCIIPNEFILHFSRSSTKYAHTRSSNANFS